MGDIANENFRIAYPKKQGKHAKMVVNEVLKSIPLE